MEFPGGVGGGGPLCEPILENPEGMGGVIGKISSVEEGMDIFWNCTFQLVYINRLPYKL